MYSGQTWVNWIHIHTLSTFLDLPKYFAWISSPKKLLFFSDYSISSKNSEKVLHWLRVKIFSAKKNKRPGSWVLLQTHTCKWSSLIRNFAQVLRMITSLSSFGYCWAQCVLTYAQPCEGQKLRSGLDLSLFTLFLILKVFLCSFSIAYACLCGYKYLKRPVCRSSAWS